MQHLSKIIRHSKTINFYRKFTNDSKTSRKHSAKPVALNIIGAGSPSEEASLSISVENADRYLFNCGEDSHRLFSDQSRKLSDLKHVFFTQNKWNCIGGISCLISELIKRHRWLPMFHGPKQLYKCIKRILCLSCLSELDFRPIDCNPKNFFEDDTLRIDFLSIKANPTSTMDPHPRDVNEALTFVGEIKSPESEVPAYFMVLDLPTKQHLEAFVEKHQQAVVDKKFEIIVHFSAKKVIEYSGYKRLLSNLNTKKHLYLNGNNEFSRLRSVYELQLKLNQIDKNVHPALKMPLNASTKACNLSQEDKSDSQIFSKYYLTGSGEIDNDSTSSNDITSYDFDHCLDINRLKTFPKIVFLGTVSAVPTKTRNNTSILLHTTRDDSMLIDCGEGTCAQIHRLYGKVAPSIIQKIRGVFISHMHNDHHTGLIELLQLRKKYLPSNRLPLLVLCPKSDMKSWLFFYDNNVEPIHDDLYFIDNENLMTKMLSERYCNQLGVHMLQTCRVPHSNITYALSVKIGQQGNFKLTFSSDTTISNNLIAMGRDSTLLIHEATYPDKFAIKAEQNKHCTLSQAIEQSQQMNAKYTILTHFSARYGNGFPYIDSAKYKNIGIAFDFMELIENDLHKLSSLNEEYQKLFK
ncbi:ribonuclease Z, mitochondrial-like [Contarinia nasturtii]|uniref:ribonuclease Z, mitochondrial-like n=1 Tax=Contarinia nasturtii TaxID=265458 RepID=UPI0012D444FC|nr:ribonuclease Z, mitochondrial-like [Contarinia nasturtii]